MHFSVFMWLCIFTFLIYYSASQDMCTNIDFNNIDPCRISVVLNISHGYCNQKMLPDAGAVEPTIQWDDANTSSRYILFMVDPDAPNPKDNYYKYWIHWLVVDIEGSDLRQGQVGGNNVISYEGPSPPIGVHRYQFYLFEQPPNFDGQTLRAGFRGTYDLAAKVATNNLCLRAAYQYFASYDPNLLTGDPMTTEASDDMCIDIDYDEVDPCNVSVVLTNSHATCNAVISPDAARTEPNLEWKGANSAKLYTLLMVNPDEPDPSDPAFRYWLHWLLVEIKGSDLRRGKVIGDSLMPYEAPDPLTGVHRYQFFLYEQPSGFDSHTLGVEERGMYDPAAVATSNNLCLKAAHQYFSTMVFEPKENQTWVYTKATESPSTTSKKDKTTVPEKPTSTEFTSTVVETTTENHTEQPSVKSFKHASNYLSRLYKAALLLLSYMSYMLVMF